MCAGYMTTQQSGMQQTQQSNPPQSQSRHLVLPGAVPTGLIIELVAEPGRTKLTGLEVDSVHMAFEESEGRRKLGNRAFRGTVRDVQIFLNMCSRHVPLLSYIYIGGKMRSGGDCGAAQWASEVGQSESTQDAMPPHLTLCTLYAAQGHTTGFNGRRIPEETGLRMTGISMPVAHWL